MSAKGSRNVLANAVLLLGMMSGMLLPGTRAMAAPAGIPQHGLSLGVMRLVYPGDSRAVPLTLTNNTDQTWLAQSSVRLVDFTTGEVAEGATPFIITPPSGQTGTG